VLQFNRTPVSVVGLGSMGRALAGAFLDAGHPTTVWNRTAAKAAPLVARGAHLVGDVEDAVATSPLIITCLATYDATIEVLQPAAGLLHGRALVTLNSGTPSGARAMAAWAGERGARFLDGAIKNVPAAVGAHDTQLYYSGDSGVFAEYEEALKTLGGDTSHLGDEPDLAALYESAVGATLLPALVGFFQGVAAVQSRGLRAETLVPYTVKWLEMIASVLPVFAREIDSGDYTEPLSSVRLFLEAAAWDEEFGRETGVDVSWNAPLHDLVSRAAEAGHADHSISALVEVLRMPEVAT
jgi:3-hydroxyisobutyrate dehydrogenase-like beta-hydroxyacid dehydrogenase